MKVKVYCTCPTWYWVVQWRWQDLLRSVCCQQSEWFFLRSWCFGFPQWHPLLPPLDSRRQKPFLQLPSSWRCLRYSTGCCCDCSTPRCCWSRWERLSEAVGYWASMMCNHLVHGLHTDGQNNDLQRTVFHFNLGHKPKSKHPIRNISLNIIHFFFIILQLDLEFFCLYETNSWATTFVSFGVCFSSGPLLVISGLKQPDWKGPYSEHVSCIQTIRLHAVLV